VSVLFQVVNQVDHLKFKRHHLSTLLGFLPWLPLLFDIPFDLPTCPKCSYSLVEPRYLLNHQPKLPDSSMLTRYLSTVLFVDRKEEAPNKTPKWRREERKQPKPRSTKSRRQRCKRTSTPRTRHTCRFRNGASGSTKQRTAKGGHSRRTRFTLDFPIGPTRSATGPVFLPTPQKATYRLQVPLSTGVPQRRSHVTSWSFTKTLSSRYRTQTLSPAGPAREEALAVPAVPAGHHPVAAPGRR
jgi:hypothetical protein